MNNARFNILKASCELADALKAIGDLECFAGGNSLFEFEEENDGVFLVLRGRIRMTVPGVPSLDRIFPTGSLLGLPATFVGRPYRLTAIATGDCEVVHLPREDFLKLMQNRPELCREATEMLCHETAFIEAAVAEQRRNSVAVN